MMTTQVVCRCDFDPSHSVVLDPGPSGAVPALPGSWFTLRMAGVDRHFDSISCLSARFLPEPSSGSEGAAMVERWVSSIVKRIQICPLIHEKSDAKDLLLILLYEARRFLEGGDPNLYADDTEKKSA